MKNILTIIAIAFVVSVGACNGATHKTGGASRDSGATHGNSGPADTSAAAHSSAAGGASSDTSHTGKNTATPVVDSGKKN
jgi:hypothetical protein